MPLLGAKSAALLTKDEATLVRSSAAASAKALTPSRLKDQIARARKLRDKYADLAKRQRGEAKGTRARSGTRAAQGNENTTKKVELFADALSRFEKELARRESKAAGKTNAAAKGAKKAKGTKAAKKKKAGGAKVAAKSGATKTASAKTRAASASKRHVSPATESSIAKRAELQRAKSGLQRSGGHMASRTRRTQARRDARR
jgi:hypothetical protein